jgi:hypothetical protein
MKGAATALSLMAALALALPALADRGQARFTVSAVVPARATLTALDAPADGIDVSAADVVRGYADVAATYRVSHNDARGYLLSFVPKIGLARTIEVQGLASGLVLVDEPVELFQSEPPGSRPLTLAFRLRLHPSVAPGRYPLPVLVDARPLQRFPQ